MHDPGERLQLDELTSNMKSVALPVDPLVTEAAGRPRIADAYRHAPAGRAEQPLLDQFRLGVRAIDRLGRCLEAARDDDMRVAFRGQCQSAHGRRFRLLGFMVASTSSSRS